MWVHLIYRVLHVSIPAINDRRELRLGEVTNKCRMVFWLNYGTLR